MGIPIDQFQEMKDRTEKARKKPGERPPSICCVCGKPITDGVRYVSPDLSRSRHAGCPYVARTKPIDPKRESITILQPLPTPVEKDILAKLNEKKETGSVRLVLDFWASEGVPRPMVEHRFCERKWKMDFAWPSTTSVYGGVYLESNGGIWIGGRHVRPAALLDEWDKIGEATILDWKPLFCQPSDLLTVKLTKLIKRALKI